MLSTIEKRWIKINSAYKLIRYKIYKDARIDISIDTIVILWNYISHNFDIRFYK